MSLTNIYEKFIRNIMESKITAAETMMTIPRKLLLSVYLIIPVLLGIVLADMFLFDHFLQPYVGIDALFFPLFLLLFNLPHIIASFFSFVDTEYVRYYRRHLFVYLPMLLVGTALLLWYDYLWGLVFFLINDMWHGVRQQVGISLILGSKPGHIHRLWTLAPFVMGSIAYVYMLRPDAFPDDLLPYLSPVLFIGAILTLLTMAAKLWTSPSSVRWYIFAVSMMFIVNYFFILTDYIFFTILAFRFVHDITAFAFYITHDHNRAKSGHRNYLYQLISRIPKHVIVLTPVLGISLAYLITTSANQLAVGYSIVILICMSHFYLESVMWKRGSPHREFVKVV